MCASSSDLKVINASGLFIIEIDLKVIVAAAHSSVGGSGVSNVESLAREGNNGAVEKVVLRNREE